MEDYKVGALGDLISATKSPAISKAARKSLNKSMEGTSKGKQNGTPNSKKSPQKRKSVVNSNESVKKLKINSDGEEDDDDDDEEVEEAVEDEKVSAAEESGNGEEDSDEEGAGDLDGEEGFDNEIDDEGNLSNEEESGEEDMEAEEDSDEEGGEGSYDDVEDEENLSDNKGSGDGEDDSDDDAPEEQASKTKEDKKVEPKLRDFCPDRTIFVGNVKLGLSKKEVINFFKKYGPVEAVRFRSIAVDNPRLGKKLSIQKKKLHAGRDTCNAYVRFQDKASTLKAIEGQNGKEFKGYHLRVTMADKESIKIDNKKTLFVGNLSFNSEDEALWKAFADCGEIESVRIVRDKRTNVSKGFAYINFKSSDSVQLALQMGDVTIHKRVLRLSTSKFAKKEKKLNTANDCCVFIAGFSAGTSKETIMKAFEDIGPLAKVRLVKDKVTKRASGCGFVTFKNTEAAQKALRTTVKINNSPIDIQVPRTSLKCSKQGKGKDSSRKEDKGKGSPQKVGKFKGEGKPIKRSQSGRVEKPGKKNEKQQSAAGSPMKSYRGSKGKAKGGNPKRKVNQGALMKNKMAKKVAPRPKT